MPIVKLTSISPIPTEFPITINWDYRIDLVLESKDFINITIHMGSPEDLASIEFTMYVIDNSLYRMAPWRVIEIRFMSGEKYICRVSEASIDQRPGDIVTMSVQALILQAHKAGYNDEENKKYEYPLLGRKLRI